MSLFRIVGEFLSEEDAGMKAAFEAAMVKRIQEKGYTMADLMYEVYQCQMKIASLEVVLASYSSIKPKAKSRKK